MTNTQLQDLLGKQVVELDFVRRHEKLGWSDIRALLGTTNYELLNSQFGFQVLHFKPPKGVGMGYDYKKYNLCVVWDMFRQEYRVFGAEQANIHKVWELDTPEKIEEFQQYFYDYIINMTNDQKLKFMGYTGEINIINTPAPVSPTPMQPGSPKAPEVQKKHVWGRISKVFAPLLDRIKGFFSRKKKK